MTFLRAIRTLAFGGAVSATLVGSAFTHAIQDGTKQVTEPVFRVSRIAAPLAGAATEDEDRVPAAQASSTSPAALVASLPPAAAAASAVRPHPLDRAIGIAHNGLAEMKAKIHDYTAILMKREAVDGVVGEPNFMRIKIRNERTTAEGTVPFSVYMKFLKPKSVAGREVIWVKGQNDNKILAHETGLIGIKTFHLDPDGWMAMKGNRHPIYEAGLENLVLKLIEKAERDRAAGDCTVTYTEDAKINGRACSLIEVVHDVRREPYEFHKAQVFIDNELQIPVRYSAFDWPTAPGAEPQLIEEYTYVKVEINVGLKNIDFETSNPEYSYPGR